MKTSLAGLLAVTFLAASAFALPPVPKYLPMALEGREDSQEYLKAFKAAAMKCSSCHVPGADKKAKGHGLNDFGQTMHKHLNDKEFMAADKARDEMTALKLFTEAWGKAVQEKNAEGKLYADLIKAGKLPGTNPEKKEEAEKGDK